MDPEEAQLRLEMELDKKAKADSLRLQRSCSVDFTALYPLPLPPGWRSAPTSPLRTPPSPLQFPPASAADVAGTSSSAPNDDGPARNAGADEAAVGSAPKNKDPARTAGDDEPTSEQQPADGPTRSDYAAMMRMALAKFQEDAAADDEEAASAVMEQAMTGLMDLTYRKAKPPELPHEFATRWPIPIAPDGTLQAEVMRDPVILVSGYSVDQTYQNNQKRQNPRTNTCTFTDHSLPYSFSVPNHLLHDMISAWCLDHSDLSPSTTSDTVSTPLEPSEEEQIQRILKLFSGNSASQREALNMIQLLTKTTKGVQPCLAKYADIIPVLINLRKKYKSSWTQDLEEERLTIILNLTMHRQNREILAGQNELPGALRKVVKKAGNLGKPTSSLAKVASIVAVLSECDMFRKRMLDAGGMKMLRDMLKIKDNEVITEAAAAILALCADDEGKQSAIFHDVPEMLLERHMFTDGILLLLDSLPKSPRVFRKISDQALQLVNIVMAENVSGPVTRKGILSAISLIYEIVERDVGKMNVVKNMEDFNERLRQLSSDRLPMQKMFQVERIIRTLSDAFPAPTVRGRSQEPSGSRLHSDG
uniref:RING-type E3 ubiquitin transferase n=1 Tax=Oryza punctata TaxID=4537 RepID=A0A0E0JZX4_ORYPU